MNKLNNIMNKLQEKTNLVLGAQNVEDILLNRKKNSIEAMIELKKNKNQEIDLTNAHSVISALAKLGFSSGSKIGLIISLTCVCEALKDEELNKQFLTNGVVDMFKLSKVFPFVGTKGENFEYESIFSQEEYVNVTDKGGRNQTILLACKDKIELFSNRIKALKQCSSAEDLVKIGKDLEIVSTVMSELEIDAAKDEEKREGMIDIAEFMNINMKQMSRNINIIDNFNDMVSSKKGYTKETVSEFVYHLRKENSLFDFDRLYKEEVEAFTKGMIENNEELTNEEIEERLNEIKDSVLDDCMVVDPLFEVVEMLLGSLKETMSTLTEKFFMNSSMKQFEELSIEPQRDEEENVFEEETLEESIYNIKKTAVVVYEMINNTFMYKNYMSMRKVEDLAKMGRNIIYTAGAARGFSERDTFLMAVDAGWYKRTTKGGKARLIKSNFKFAAVEAVFGNELKYHFNEEAMRKEASLEIPDELLEFDIFEEGTALEFENGECIINIQDEEFCIFRTDDMEFNGTVLLELDEEGYVVFIEDVNQYEYDVVDYVVFDNIADLTKNENRIAPEEFEALFIEAETQDGVFAKKYSKSKLVPMTRSEKNGYDLSEEELKAEGERLAPVLREWCNKMQLEICAGLNCNISQNHYHLSNEAGNARIFGKVHDFFMQDEEHTDIHTIATAVGAIVVKEA